MNPGSADKTFNVRIVFHSHSFVFEHMILKHVQEDQPFIDLLSWTVFPFE